MTNALSLPPTDDLDTQLRKVARDLAQGLYELDDILKNNDVTNAMFNKFKEHPRFLDYLKQEREAWNAAGNVSERAKLKAGIIIEEFMVSAHGELSNNKTPLNQRVELAKFLGRIAGMGEPKVGAGGGPGGGFQLHINIAPGAEPVVVKAQMVHTIDHEPTQYDDDGYDPFTSPTTLDD